MLKSFLKASVYFVCAAWFGIASAAGLGGINVTSALGQPLKAEINLVAVDKVDKSTLVARLASADAFKNAGIDYPYVLPKLKFQIENRADGELYVKLTSAQPINDPFVSLLVELSWSSGKLLREYTFLLDPVGYEPEQPKVADVKPIEPVLAAPVVVPEAASEPVAAEPIAETPIAPEAATVPAADAEPVESAPVAESAVVAAEPEAVAPAESAPASQDPLSKEEAIAEPAAAVAVEPITVKRGDTLSKIAARIKPADVSLERMLVALYRENAGVFDGHNMNRIKAGKILNIPQGDAIAMLPQADAVEEVRAQAADWNSYRQKLAAARAVSEEHADKQEVAGKISTAVTDKAMPEKEATKEVLKLSKGEAPNDKAVGGGKSTAEEKAIAKEEEAIAKSKAMKEAQERTAILEKNVKDMQRLEELKKDSVVASAPAATVTLAASAPQAASSVAAAKPKVAPPAVIEQPPLMDQLLAEPLYLAAGAALLLALGGLGIMASRRGKAGKKTEAKPVVNAGGSSKSEGGLGALFKRLFGEKKKKLAVTEKKGEDAGSATGRIAAPVAPSPDTGDFTQAATPAAASSSLGSEEVDPIGEADLFLTFGRDAQAEEVLKEALKKEPGNIAVKLKLLSIYANRKDSNSFFTYASEIKESGDEAAWKKASAMGLELEPNNPFYGGVASVASAAGKTAEAAAPAVDFDLGFGAVEPAQSEFSSQNTVVLESPSQEKTSIMSSNELRDAVQATTMDFDITGTRPGTPTSPASGQETVMDFDITGTHPGVPVSSETEQVSVVNMDDLVFDVTATHPSLGAVASATSAAPAEDNAMTFTLDFPSDLGKAETSSKPAPVVPDIGLGEINLNLDSLGIPAAAAENKSEGWHEVATKLDLAKAYQEMGDVAGAKEILDEVLRDGDEQQRATAQALLQQL